MSRLMEMVVSTLESIENDIRFAGLGLRPEEVVSGGRLILLSSFLIGLAFAILNPHPLNIVLTVVVSLLLQRVVISYPATCASRIERSSLREAPEVFGHLMGGAGSAMTYENAVLASSRNSAGMLRGGFERMVWNVYTRGTNIPEEFEQYTRTWRGRNRGFEEALRRFSAAAKRGRTGNFSSLISPIHVHTRRKLKGYLASLRTPVNIVFALGIALPVMIASIMPMSSLAIASPVGIEGDQTGKGGPLSPVGFAIVLDVIFPLGMFLYCREVLSNRPLSSSSGFSFRSRDLLGLVGASVITISLSIAVLSGLLLITVVGLLVVLVLASSVMAVAMLHASYARGQQPPSRKTVSEAFEILGDSLLMGDSFEISLLKTAERLEGTDLASSILHDIFLVSRGTIKGGATLIHKEETDQSSVFGTNLKVVADAARKDGTLAGSMAKRIAADLRELSRMEADARDELKPVVQTVNSTLTFFSPIVLGTTASMLLLMEAYFEVSGGLTSKAFVGILGTLLCINLAVASYFTESLRSGDIADVLSRIGKGLLTAIPIFALSFLCASILFGVL
jgi:hypothetical protein